MQNFRKTMKNNKGFSLVELIIVIAILAILVGILAPQYIKYIDRSRKSSDVAAMDGFVSAIKVTASDLEYTPSLLGKTFTMTMNTTGTTVTATGTGANAADVDDAFEEALGADWATTEMRSTSWEGATAGALATEISATVAITAEGSVTVTYAPASFANFGK